MGSIVCCFIVQRILRACVRRYQIEPRRDREGAIFRLIEPKRDREGAIFRLLEPRRDREGTVCCGANRIVAQSRRAGMNTPARCRCHTGTHRQDAGATPVNTGKMPVPQVVFLRRT